MHALGGDHADLLRGWLHEARLPDLPASRTGPLQRARAAVTRRLPG